MCECCGSASRQSQVRDYQAITSIKSSRTMRPNALFARVPSWSRPVGLEYCAHGTMGCRASKVQPPNDRYGTNGEIQLAEFKCFIADWACTYADGNESAAKKWMLEVISEVTNVLHASQKASRQAALTVLRLSLG